MKANEPAYPMQYENGAWQLGLTKLEYFTAKALPAHILLHGYESAPCKNQSDPLPEQLAWASAVGHAAVRSALAALAELEKHDVS